MQTPLAFFCLGTKGVNLSAISHWWVAPGASNGAALCISMCNGKQVSFDVEDGGGDGYSAEKHLMSFIAKVGQR